MFKTKVEISPLFFAVLTLFLLADRNRIAFPAIAFSFAHETGHFAVLLLQKTVPKKIRCSVAGIQMELPSNLGFGKKISVLSAGFVTNFGLALLFFAFKRPLFAFINLTIGVFTMLPLSSTDGGSIIKELFAEYFTECEKRFEKDFFICSCVIFSIFLIAVFAATKNYYLLVAIFYLIICTIKN